MPQDVFDVLVLLTTIDHQFFGTEESAAKAYDICKLEPNQLLSKTLNSLVFDAKKQYVQAIC